DRRLVRTGLSTCIAHLISKGARPTSTDSIGEGTVIPGVIDQGTVAEYVHPGSRAGPGQIDGALPVYQAPLCSEYNWRGCRRSCRSWARRRGSRRELEDVGLQLGCNSRVATDDVGEPCRLDRRQRGRVQIGFVPEAVSIAQALELIG